VSSSNPARFNYAGGSELILDAHTAPLKPRGERLMSALYGLSLYGNYHYYAVASNSLYLGLTCLSSTLLTMMLLNAAIFTTMGAVEIMVTPTRDRVRFQFMGGRALECAIKDVKFVRMAGEKVTLNAKNAQGRDYRIVVDTSYRSMQWEYFNPEFLMALGHPDVHKI